MGRWVSAIAAVAFAIAPWVADAQEPTFRATTEVVSLNVTVLGRGDTLVTGLTGPQFTVYEDGVPQTLEYFAPGELPLDVVILLDTSASMGASMPLVQQSATRLVRALRASDRATVMGISSGLRILQPLTDDMQAVEQAIRQTRAAGRTPLYASIYTALCELAKIRRMDAATARRQAIVVLSDGHDTASGFAFDDLLTSVRRSGVPIYTIAPRPSKALKMQRELVFGETTYTQDFELRTLAAETGARAFFPEAVGELAGVFDDIARELANQYSLGYQSTNAARDGAFRRIAVQVAAPAVRWRTRAGYLAALPTRPAADDRD